MRYAPTLSPEDEKKVMRGLAVQPFVAAALGFALFPIVDYTGSLVYGGRAVNVLDAAIPFGVLVGVVASFVTGLIAYPGLLWMLKRGPLTQSKTLISGAVLGNVPGALIVLALIARQLSRGVTPTLANVAYGPAGAVRLIVLGTVVGLVSAAVFWWVSGRQLGGRRG